MTRPAAGLILLILGLTLAPRLEATPIPWAHPDGTTHYYERVDDLFTWSEARLLAEGMSHDGRYGHLVTITTQAEYEFLRAGPLGSFAPAEWTGGFQAPGSPEPDGGWGWVTGEPWWRGSPHQFDNSSGRDSYLLISSKWEDGHEDIPLAFVVEYDQHGVPEAGTLGLFALGLMALGLELRRRSRPAR